jgi:ABC-type branched-subunit amino acid transport system ATPase component
MPRRRPTIKSEGDVLSTVQALGTLSSSRTSHQGAGTLVVTNLVKTFGGITATDNLSLELPAQKITALVGPNGAGKTTVFSLVTGSLRPDQGRITYRGRDITGKPPNFVARQGVVRSFQDVKIFGGIPRWTMSAMPSRETRREALQRYVSASVSQQGQGAGAG